MVLSPASASMSVFHDGHLDPRIPGMDVEDSFKATEVDWDAATGEWFSRLRDGREICRGGSKEEVVVREHEILAQMELDGEPIPRPVTE